MSNLVKQLELKANQLRKDVLEVVYESKAGPYVHHCTGVHMDVLPIYKVCKYIPELKVDFYDDIEEEVKAWIRGE